MTPFIHFHHSTRHIIASWIIWCIPLPALPASLRSLTLSHRSLPRLVVVSPFSCLILSCCAHFLLSMSKKCSDEKDICKCQKFLDVKAAVSKGQDATPKCLLKYCFMSE